MRIAIFFFHKLCEDMKWKQYFDLATRGIDVIHTFLIMIHTKNYIIFYQI